MCVKRCTVMKFAPLMFICDNDHPLSSAADISACNTGKRRRRERRGETYTHPKFLEPLSCVIVIWTSGHDTEQHGHILFCPHTVQSDITRCGDSRVGHTAKRPVLQPIDSTSQCIRTILYYYWMTMHCFYWMILCYNELLFA